MIALTVPQVAVEGFLRVTRANRRFVDPDAARRHVARRALRPARYAPPRGLWHVEVEADREGGWPVYRVQPSTGTARGSVVYLHGGGWVNEIVLQHWQLVAQLAVQAGTTVIVPIYPLVPFGTAAQVVAGVAELTRRARSRYGTVRLAGDSAGGQIALSTALQLRGTDPVDRVVLISPALDLSWSNPRIPAVQPTDPWLAVPGGRVFSELWRDDLPVHDPRVSPLAGDLRGLGPLTVFTGTRDILNPDARLLREAAAAAGVEHTFHEGRGLLHDYPLFPTRAGRRARRLIVETVREVSG